MLLPDGGVAGSTPASTADSRAASGAQAAKLAGVLRLVKVRVPAEHVPRQLGLLLPSRLRGRHCCAPPMGPMPCTADLHSLAP